MSGSCGLREKKKNNNITLRLGLPVHPEFCFSFSVLMQEMTGQNAAPEALGVVDGSARDRKIRGLE